MSEESAVVLKKKAVGITKEAAIVINATENPKREGSASFDRFQGYLTDPAPATVQNALDNGLTMGDINYDFTHGTIDVDGASIEEYEPTTRAPKDADADADTEISEATEETF